jgi:hypothetical protein
MRQRTHERGDRRLQRRRRPEHADLARGLFQEPGRELLDWHGFFEWCPPSLDYYSKGEHWALASDNMAWEDQSRDFCCLGAPRFCDGGRMPHVVAADAAHRQRAMLHMVAWGCDGPPVANVSVQVMRQCRA